MGSCTSGLKKKKKGDSAEDNEYTDIKQSEDVMYASINHSTSKTLQRARLSSDDDYEYASVKVPEVLHPEPNSEESSKDECADDYVLMG